MLQARIHRILPILQKQKLYSMWILTCILCDINLFGYAWKITAGTLVLEIYYVTRSITKQIYWRVFFFLLINVRHIDFNVPFRTMNFNQFFKENEASHAFSDYSNRTGTTWVWPAGMRNVLLHLARPAPIL